MTKVSIKQKRLCFVVSPIGTEGSPIRKRADAVLKHVIKPACTRVGFVSERADEICEPGQITPGIIKKILQADIVVADLTGHNPNVFYELAIRHFVGGPTVQLIEASNSIPFDIYDTRTIRFDSTDLSSAASAKTQLIKFLRSCDHGKVLDNPITRVLREVGIQLPLAKHNSPGLWEAFRELSSNIEVELKAIREERDVLINSALKVGERITQNESLSHKQGISGELAGLWTSNMGLVKLAHNEGNVAGEYQYGGDWRGTIVGKLIGNRLVFRWRWNSGEPSGLGVLSRKGRDLLFGGWWYDSQTPDYESLIADPSQADELPLTDENRWEMWRAAGATFPRSSHHGKRR